VFRPKASLIVWDLAQGFSNSLGFGLRLFQYVVILESLVIVISDSKVIFMVILDGHFDGHFVWLFCWSFCMVIFVGHFGRSFWTVIFVGHFWSLKIVFLPKFWCDCSGDIINS
jgi:hypothetical protein